MSEDENKEEKEKDSVYDEEGREELVDSGEMSPEEAGFMQGYDQADEEEDKKENKEEKEEEE